MIFILGIERSATTWVASILDHHPKTDVYMEPLSDYTSRFVQWPDRFTALDDMQEKAEYFEKEFGLLKRHRRFLFSRLSDTSRAWQWDLNTAQFLSNKELATVAIRDFLELNYHHKNQNLKIKKEPPLQTVIKELRLNFNAALITKLGASAKVLVTIREMASCVRSILQQIEKGNLVELKCDLTKKYGDISPQKVCMYWRESYSTLIETLQKKQISYKIVSHTDLLESPDETVKDFLTFLEFDFTSDIGNFLAYSNQSGSGKHSTRRSRQSLLDKMQEHRDFIYPKVKDQLQKIELHPVLKKYIHR